MDGGDAGDADSLEKSVAKGANAAIVCEGLKVLVLVDTAVSRSSCEELPKGATATSSMNSNGAFV